MSLSRLVLATGLGLALVSSFGCGSSSSEGEAPAPSKEVNTASLPPQASQAATQSIERGKGMAKQYNDRYKNQGK